MTQEKIFKGYKVVIPRGPKTYQSCLMHLPDYVATYQVGKWTYRNNRKNPFLVFRSKKNAKRFIKDNSDSFEALEVKPVIFSCEAKEFREPHFPRTFAFNTKWKHMVRLRITCMWPYGTFTTTAVKLIEKVKA